MEDMDNVFEIVGIGASAGGFEALRDFVTHLERSNNISYIIAQHLDPSQPTMLLELLSKFSKIEMIMAQNDMIIERNKIYICPPNNNITVQNNIIKLSLPENSAYPKPSINILFTSLAKSIEQKAVGIVLSGTGTDGATGIEDIKNAGGITIVQDERTAKYASMPRAAIDTGCVDIVLSPNQIAQELPKIIKAPNILKEMQVVTMGMDRIFDLLLDKFNVDFSDYKMGTMQRRLERRMSVNKVDKIDDYIKILLESKNELTLLYKDLLVVVTSFFRDYEMFDELEKYLDKAILKNSDDSIRVWVPGCATGEEAYTVAILLRERLRKHEIRKSIQIFATDISDEAIAKARNALFTKEEIEHINPEYIKNYFILSGDRYEIKKDLRDQIIFSKHDVIKDPPFLNIDLVTCRNLLIYFNNNLQKRVLGIFYHSLKMSGLLFLGKSESISNLNTAFITLSNKSKIYQKDFNAKVTDMDVLTYYPKRYSNTVIENVVPTPKQKKKSIDPDEIVKDSISLSIYSQLVKDYIVIDKNNHISYTDGEVEKYISFPKGSFNNDVFSFISKEIRLDLRVLVSKARKELVSFNQRVKIQENNSNLIKFVNIVALPLTSSEYTTGSVAILFIDSSDELDISENNGIHLTSYAKELETELLMTKEQLQTTIEELETTNEELQSTNEELQSTNEELQSTNEELETSNEELQSTNEELTTVNDELELKSFQLRKTNNDLINIFNTINYAIVIVDKNLMIQRFTKDITDIFDISITNIHESITTVKAHVDIGNVRTLLEDTIDNNNIKQFEIQQKDDYYQCSIEPYMGENDKCEGAVLSFYNITSLKKNEEKILTIQHELEQTLDSIDSIVVISDNGEKLVESNENFYKFFNQFNSLDDFNKQYNCLCELFEKVDLDDYFYLDENSDFDEQLVNIVGKDLKAQVTKNGNRHIFKVKIGLMSTNNVKRYRFILSLTDVTLLELKKEELELLVKKEAEIKIKQEKIIAQQSKMAALGEMIGNIAHQWRQPLSMISTCATGMIMQDELNNLDYKMVEKQCEMINQNAQYLSQTIDDFKNFIKGDRQIENLELSEVMESFITLVDASVKNNQINLILNFENDIKLNIYKNEIQQCFINIFNNAKDVVKDKPEEERYIFISTKKLNDKVEIRFKDSGGGIPIDVLPRIFEPYFTTKHQSQGTGLGLNMVYNLITNGMDGVIEAKNVSYKYNGLNLSGAEFMVSLPLN